MIESLLSSLSAVALILGLISVGFFAGKLRIIDSTQKSFVVKFLVNIAVPAMCINSVFTRFGEVGRESFLKLFAPSIAAMLITLAIALLLARLFKIQRKRYGIFVVACAFSNSMFVGMPMCKELFGEAGVPYVIAFYIINTLMFWTVGAWLIQGSGDVKKPSFAQNLKRIATPPLISLIASVLLFEAGVRLPDIVGTFCGYLGGTVSPLALLYVGFIIYENGFSGINKTVDVSFVCAMVMRFLVAPAVVYALCRLCGVNPLATGVYTVEMGMPVMTQSVIVGAAYGADEKYAASAMTISTLLCLVAVPVFMLLVGNQ